MDLLIGHVLEAIPVEERLVVIGQSLGASLAIHAVAHSQYKERVSALISIAAFSDYHDIAQDALAKSWIFWLFQWPLSKTVNNSYSPLKSVDKIAQIPTIILHSQDDEIIDYYHALKLWRPTHGRDGRPSSRSRYPTGAGTLVGIVVSHPAAVSAHRSSATAHAGFAGHPTRHIHLSDQTNETETRVSLARRRHPDPTF